MQRTVFLFIYASLHLFSVSRVLFGGFHLIFLFFISHVAPKDFLQFVEDEEITDLMDSISSAEDTGDESNGDFDSDDSVCDANNNCSADDLLVDECLYDINSMLVVDAIHASINISDLDQQIDAEPIAASSPIPSTSAQFFDNQHSTITDASLTSNAATREGKYLFVVCSFVAAKMHRHFFFRRYCGYC